MWIHRSFVSGVRAHLMIARRPRAALMSLTDPLPQHRGWRGLMPWHRVDKDGRTFSCDRCRQSTQINEKGTRMRDAVAIFAVTHCHVNGVRAGDLGEDGRSD